MKPANSKTPDKLFSYDEVDEATASVARVFVADYVKRTRDFIFETGSRLLKIKEQMPHGTFQKWVETEAPLSMRLAQKMMSAVARLGDKSELFSDFPAKTVYDLSAKSTPDSVINEVILRLEQDIRITPEEIDLKIVASKCKSVKVPAAEQHHVELNSRCSDSSNLTDSDLPEQLVISEASPVEEFVSMIKPSIDGRHHQAIALISQIDARALVAHLRHLYC